MCFSGVAGPVRSEERVALRVSQGGHDVPPDKLTARFPRTMTNLKQAIREFPCVLVFDNDDVRTHLRLLGVFKYDRTSPSLCQLPTVIGKSKTE